MNNLSDLLREEAQRFDNIVYFSKPYSCAMEEALSYFKNYTMPKEDQYTIDRSTSQTVVSLKPMKGSRKRKLYTIVMWTT